MNATGWTGVATLVGATRTTAKRPVMPLSRKLARRIPLGRRRLPLPGRLFALAPKDGRRPWHR
eukprot:10084202-Alexandrium_andersonii.AAC.1